MSSSTVSPAVALFTSIVNDGVVMSVRLSELVPCGPTVSEAACRSGAASVAIVVSIVTASAVEVEVLPAASLSLAAILCGPSVSVPAVSVISRR